MIYSESGDQFEVLEDLYSVSLGDKIMFGSPHDYRDIEPHLWTVTDTYCGPDGNPDAITVKSATGSETHEWKESNGAFRLIQKTTSTKRKGNEMSDIEKLWKLVETTAATLGATEDDEHRMMLYGPPGTGKTRLAVKHGLRKGQGVFNVYLTEETSAAELRGHYIPAGDGIWNWQHGPGMLAPMTASRLVVNEINNASGDCLDLLLAICDDFEMFQFTLPNGETIFPTAGYQVIATMNGEPEDLPPALQDRFVIRAKLTEPHPDAIKRLPEDIREAVRQKSVGSGDARFTSIRSWLAFDKLRKSGITEAEAALLVFEKSGKSVIEALMIQRGGKLYAAPGAKKKAPARKSSKTVAEAAPLVIK